MLLRDATELFFPCLLRSLHFEQVIFHPLAGPAAFRPRVHATSVYSPLVENGRPVLQGLLAVDIIAKEVFPKQLMCYLVCKF